MEICGLFSDFPRYRCLSHLVVVKKHGIYTSNCTHRAAEK